MIKLCNRHFFKLCLRQINNYKIINNINFIQIENNNFPSNLKKKARITQKTFSQPAHLKSAGKENEQQPADQSVFSLSLDHPLNPPY